MAKPTCKISHATKGVKAAAGVKAKAGDPTPFAFDLMDDGTGGGYTISGTDNAGAKIDISASATHTVTSDNLAAVTADPPGAVTGVLHGVLPVGGKANVTFVVTANDGSWGPFTIAGQCSVVGGGVTGVAVSFDSATIQ